MNDPLPMDLQDYEPDEENRVYYESVMNGDIGYLFKKGGKTFVNRGEGYPALLYRHIEWKPVLELRPLTQYHVGLICFEADKGMKFAMGELAESRADWRNLTDEERTQWMIGEKPGVKAVEQRRALASAIRGALKRFVA